MEEYTEQFIEQLAKRGRILLLGGMAVIAHGLARVTKDIDIWLEPFATPGEWSDVVQDILATLPGTQTYDLRNQIVVKHSEIVKLAERDSVIRIIGLDRPLDIFRVPHNLEVNDFDAVWERAKMQISSMRVPDEIDLLVTKEETDRPHDIADISFLEDKVRRYLSDVLKTCSYDDAKNIFARYADHETCRASLKNTDSNVRDLGLNLLQEWAKSGDPFALEILKK